MRKLRSSWFAAVLLACAFSWLSAAVDCIPALAQVGQIVTVPNRQPPPAAGSTTTLNSSDKAAAVGLDATNLIMTNTGTGSVRSIASASTGLKHYEVTLGAGVNAYDHAVGLGNSSASLTAGPGSPDTNSIAYYNGDANIYAGGGTAGSTGLSATAPGDVISVAVDLSNNAIWVRLNCGNWNNSGTADPSTNTGGVGGISGVSKPWYVLGYGGANGVVNTFNFGATAYSCTPPSGASNW